MRAWAKTNRLAPSDPDFRYLSTRGHAIDAAAAAKGLLVGNTLRAFSAAAGRPLDPVDVARIAVLCGIHDIGKVLLGFRGKIFNTPWWEDPPSRDHCLPLIDLVRLARRRSLSSHHKQFLNAAGFKDVGGWFATFPGALDALEVLFSHHGGPKAGVTAPARAFADQLAPFQESDAFEEAKEVVHAMREAYPEAFSARKGDLPVSPKFLHLLLGLAMQADWMASTVSWDGGRSTFGLSGDDFDTVVRTASSSTVSSVILSGCGFHDALAARTPIAPTSVVPNEILRPLQETVLTVPLADLIVGIEAPTGEGKTEAALLRYLDLHAAGLVDGMYFAVPTRSAGVSLHKRVRNVVKRLFPEAPPVVLAVPGAMPADPQDAGPIPWSSDRGKYLASGIAVGTVDQLLLSGLRVGGAHQRAFAASRVLLVVDEVHACDPYMSTVLGRVLGRHVSLGGHAVLLSATLGDSGLSALGRPAADFDDACERLYPAIWHGQRFDTLRWKGFDADDTRRRQVRFYKQRQAQAAQSVKRAVDRGARVLIILSTVQDAIVFQRALEQAGVPTMTATSCDGTEVGVMHHGRYAAVDRAVLDRTVSNLFQPGPRREPMGIACVGTQTLEQSLDIDADLLVTDLCPADVMIQRLGRLHRANGCRPDGLEQPMAILLDPGDLDRLIDERGNLSASGNSARFSYVYRNVIMLQATLDFIDRGSVGLPDECRVMVETATHPESLRRIAIAKGAKWSLMLNGIMDAENGEAAKGWRDTIDWDMRPLNDPNLIHSEEEIRTRIGADSVDLDVSFDSFLGNRISSLSIRLALLRGGNPRDIDLVSRDDRQAVIRCGEVFLTYDRFGLNVR